MNPTIRSDCAAPIEPWSSQSTREASSHGFLARLLQRSKPYWLPLVALDCVVVYYFSLHISFAQAAKSLVEAIGSFHPLDPRAEAVIADAQSNLTKSVLSLLAATGGAMLCVAAFAGLCWSARCLRKSRRLATEIGGTLWIDDKATAVTAVDVSEGGCRIRLGIPLPQGSAVRVKLGETEALAKVVWRSGQQAGLQFSPPPAAGLQSPREEEMQDLGNAGCQLSLVPRRLI